MLRGATPRGSSRSGSPRELTPEEKEENRQRWYNIHLKDVESWTGKKTAAVACAVICICVILLLIGLVFAGGYDPKDCSGELLPDICRKQNEENAKTKMNMVTASYVFAGFLAICIGIIIHQSYPIGYNGARRGRLEKLKEEYPQYSSPLQRELEAKYKPAYLESEE